MGMLIPFTLIENSIINIAATVAEVITNSTIMTIENVRKNKCRFMKIKW